MIKTWIEKLKAFRIYAIIHRFTRVVLTPFIFVGLILIGLYSLIAGVYWILTGVNTLPMVVNLQNKLIIFCWGGNGT
jgi:succinate dehydrogenase/fumarate reductase cytochrome b subunit